MGEELTHHGILGMHWGVRRSPEELGHVIGGKNQNGGSAKEKSPGKATKRASAMSDEELRTRINRLNMEEQYENLVARQKSRSTSTAKRLISEALQNLGSKMLGVGVDKLIAKMTKEKDGFDINKYKNENVYSMDAETLAKVAKWYKDAQSITAGRSKLGTP